MVDAVANIALETLRDLLIEESKFLLSVGGQVEEVRRELQTMHSFLKDADQRRDNYNSETVRNWVFKLRDLATQAENVLERYAVQVQSKRQGKTLKKILKRFTCILGEISDLHQIGNEIQVIRSRMADLTNSAESIAKIGESSSSSVDHDVMWSRKTFGYDTEPHFVGMEDERARLESLLTRSDERSNRVISICGMGGLGKTTLATKIYRGEAVQRCFDVRAWVCISQKFQLRIVLQELLKQFFPNEDEKNIREMEENGLGRKLLGVQDEKKCMVFVDDIWDVDHWNMLSRFFRISEDRCRVLVTTRNEKIGAGEYHVHKLKYLSEDEGWELLQKMALPQELPTTQPKLLEGLGREMVRKCGCLPLAVSVIGGILRQENTQSGWEKVCKNTDSYLQRGDGVQLNKRVTQILDLSYNVLPYNLKPCFLYLGCFPEDTEIPAEELYLLWMAEGMISSQDRGREETLRDVAERYLSELENRCLVQLTMDEESTYNRFKSCRLHDLMRDLCLLKGKEEGFLEVVDTKMRKEDIFSVSRLAIHLDKPQDDIREFKNLRSLMFPTTDWELFRKWGVWKPFRKWNSLVSVNFGTFKSLKILVLQGFESGNRKLPKGIEKLMLLKHLSVHGSDVNKLPSAICKLSCLHSLDLRTDDTIVLPNSIHKLKSLRHLYLNGSYRRKVVGGVKVKLSSLIELETLIGFSSELDDITDLIKLPKLRVLDGEVCDEYSWSMIVDHILKHQDQFRETRLYISGVGGCSADLFGKTLMCHSLSKLTIFSCVNKLPSYEPQLGKNLIRLKLCGCYISEDPMEMLEKLPMLRLLYLWENSFDGREMVCRTNGFPQLRELILSDLPNLVEWRVEENAMPNLYMLRILGCRQLKMIPEGLKFITTLKELMISRMSQELMDRVRVVEGKEGEDYHKIRRIPSIQLGDDSETDDD